MKKNTIILLIIIVTYSISYTQTLSVEEKNLIISGLYDDNEIARYNSLEIIIKEKIKEAENILLERIWLDSLDLQAGYIKALHSVDSPFAFEYSNKYIKKILTENNALLKISQLRLIVDVINVQLDNNYYDNIKYVFDLIDIEKPETSSEALVLLKKINQKSSTYKEKAKQELIYYSQNGNLDWQRWYSIKTLDELYGRESFPYIVKMFTLDSSSTLRYSAFEELLVKYPCNEMHQVIKNFIQNDTINIYKIDMAKKIIELFGLVSDIKFIDDYCESEKDEMVKFFLKEELSSFIPSSPVLTTTPQVILDSLISYTKQSYNYGWIKSVELKNRLDRYLNFLKKYIPAQRGKVSQMIIDKMRSIAATADTSEFTTHAYKFIYYTAGYLKERIEPGGIVFDPNNIQGKADVFVINNGGSYSYKYKITNTSTGSSGIGNVYITKNITNDNYIPPQGWETNREITVAGLAGYNAINENSEIKQGSMLDGFVVNSTGLPTLGKIYLQSSRPLFDSLDVYTNSSIVETIIPKAVPQVFDAKSFTDTLIYINNKCLEKGWYTASWAHNVQKTALDNVKLMLTLNVPASSLIIMQQFIQTLESYNNSNFINDNGYYLLKSNCEYLIEKLKQIQR